METLLDTHLLEPIEILGTCGPWHRRGLRCCLTDLYPQNCVVLWMHKKGVFTQKVWYLSRGEEDGITRGAPTNLCALQSLWVCTVMGTATKERKGQDSNWFELNLLIWLYLNLSRCFIWTTETRSWPKLDTVKTHNLDQKRSVTTEVDLI